MLSVVPHDRQIPSKSWANFGTMRMSRVRLRCCILTLAFRCVKLVDSIKERAKCVGTNKLKYAALFVYGAELFKQGK